MSDRSKKASEQEPSRQAQDAAKLLSEAVREIRDRGDLPALKRIFNTLERDLMLDEGALAPAVAGAEAQIKNSRERLGQELKALAREAQCEFRYQPPFITFGCVRLKEKSSQKWELLILDEYPIEVLSGGSAARLAARCIHHIESIENALRRVKQVGADIEAALELLRRTHPGLEKANANLIMVLCTYGRGIRKQFASAHATAAEPISRAQFGYLLSRIREIASNGEDVPRLRYEPATQHSTSDPSLYISLPQGGSNPRVAAQHSPITSISLINDHR